jgi:hypothetical protein
MKRRVNSPAFVLNNPGNSRRTKLGSDTARGSHGLRGSGAHRPWKRTAPGPVLDHLPQPVHNSRPIEVDTRRTLVLERVEGCTLGKDVERLRVGVPSDRLEERMSRRHPLQAVRLCRLAIGRAAWVAICQGRELPVRVLLVAAEDRRGARRLEGMQDGRCPPGSARGRGAPFA